MVPQNRRRKNIVDQIIPWVRINLNNPEDNRKHSLTFEYKDTYLPLRYRYYKLSDMEFLLIQLALSAAVLNYSGNKIVGTINLDGETRKIIGDNFIEMLEILHTIRNRIDDTDVYAKSKDFVKVVKHIIKKVESEAPKRNKSWKAACKAIDKLLTKISKEFKKYSI